MCVLVPVPAQFAHAVRAALSRTLNSSLQKRIPCLDMTCLDPPPYRVFLFPTPRAQQIHLLPCTQKKQYRQPFTHRIECGRWRGVSFVTPLPSPMLWEQRSFLSSAHGQWSYKLRNAKHERAPPPSAISRLFPPPLKQPSRPSTTSSPSALRSTCGSTAAASAGGAACGPLERLGEAVENWEG